MEQFYRKLKAIMDAGGVNVSKIHLNIGIKIIESLFSQFHILAYPFLIQNAVAVPKQMSEISQSGLTRNIIVTL